MKGKHTLLNLLCVSMKAGCPWVRYTGCGLSNKNSSCNHAYTNLSTLAQVGPDIFGWVGLELQFALPGWPEGP